MNVELQELIQYKMLSYTSGLLVQNEAPSKCFFSKRHPIKRQSNLQNMKITFTNESLVNFLNLSSLQWKQPKDTNTQIISMQQKIEVL